MENFNETIIPQSLKDKYITPYEDILKEFSINFQNAKNFRQHKEKEWTLNLIYLNGKISELINNQSAREKVKKIENSLINIIYEVMNIKLGQMIINNINDSISFELSILPNEVKDDQNKIIEFLNDFKKNEIFLKQYWKNLKLENHNFKVFQDYLYLGTGVLELIWNTQNKTINENGILECNYLPLSSVYLQPNIPNFQDSTYLIIKENMDIITLQKSFELSDDEINYIKNNNQNTTTQAQTTYSLMNNNYNQENISKENEVSYYRYYVKSYNNNKIIISCYMLISLSNNYNFFYCLKKIDNIEINKFPFAIIYANQKPTDIYGTSIITQLIPIQAEMHINLAISKRQALLNANPLLFIDGSSGIDPNAIINSSKSPYGAIITVTGGNLDQSIRKVDVSSTLSPELNVTYNNFKNNMYSIAGINEINTGNASISGASTGAVSIINQNSQTPNQILQEEARKYFLQIYNIMIEYLINNSKSNHSLLTPIGYLTINNENLIYNKNINLNILFSNDLSQRNQTIINLYNMQQQYPEADKLISEIDLINALNLPDKESRIYDYLIKQSIDLTEIAVQITSLIETNAQLKINQQTNMEIIKNMQQSNVDPQQINNYIKQLQSQPQPLSDQQLINIVTKLFSTPFTDSLPFLEKLISELSTNNEINENNENNENNGDNTNES